MAKIHDVIKFLKQEQFDFSLNDIALNGIQVENSGDFQQIIAATDFSEQLINRLAHKQNLILVHHGFYWGVKMFSITNRYYRYIKKLIEMDSALLAIHLPLDIHPKYGNNAVIAKQLNLSIKGWIGDYKGHSIVLKGDFDKERQIKDVCHVIERENNTEVMLLNHGSPTVKLMAICSGGGGFALEEAKAHGCDTYLTGDRDHTLFHLSKELKINLIFAGHYATENGGVIETAKILSQHFSVPWHFEDIPTNL